MQLKNILAFGALLVAGGMAHADAVAPFTVNFQSLGTTTAFIYDATTNPTGAYAGLLFSQNALTAGGYGVGDGNFTPDGADDVALTFLSSDSNSSAVQLTITLANGGYFTNQFAMDFVGFNGTGSLELLDGSAVVLNDQSFVSSQGDCVKPTQFTVCNWQNVAFDFSGDATTVVLNFASSSDQFFFNNLSFGASAASAPGNSVPEPTGTALTAAALGALALVRRRSK